jgi:hypothetical protein
MYGRLSRLVSSPIRPVTRRKLVFSCVLVVALGTFVLATRGPAAPKPNPPGTFSFAVLGDAPYFFWEDFQYSLVLKELEANDLSLVIHVGDIFWRPCSDSHYERSRDWYNGLRHPVIFTPGDNEWFDCWERGSGGYAPLERLDRLREVFYPDPQLSLGSNPLTLESQGSGQAFATYVENARWRKEDLIFATVHLIGSWNGLVLFDGRTAEEDQASIERTAAATAWMQETFEVAGTDNAKAVVLAFHANPNFEQPENDRYRRTYEPFLEALEEEIEAFGKPVLIVHGDDHEYLVDHPMIRRTTGKRLDNLTRMQVPGSPRVGWVRVTVTAGAGTNFTFESNVVPIWKLW